MSQSTKKREDFITKIKRTIAEGYYILKIKNVVTFFLLKKENDSDEDACKNKSVFIAYKPKAEQLNTKNVSKTVKNIQRNHVSDKKMLKMFIEDKNTFILWYFRKRVSIMKMVDLFVERNVIGGKNSV